MRTVPPPRLVVIWSGVISLLVVLTSVAGLADPAVYEQETQNWATQAQGQDVGNLLAVVVLLVAALRYRNGSHRAGLVGLGSLMYLVYAFVVYAVAVHLNYLFLAYVAVLGLSAWGVILGVNLLRGTPVAYSQGHSRTFASWVVIATGVLFAGLWLGELVPALLNGTVPASLTDAGLWVNPIHVIDLSMVLPGFIVCGVAARRGRDHGLFWLGPWLVFSVLMGSSIIAAMVLMTVRGSANTVPATAMVSVVVTASLLAVRAHLRDSGTQVGAESGDDGSTSSWTGSPHGTSGTRSAAVPQHFVSALDRTVAGPCASQVPDRRSRYLSPNLLWLEHRRPAECGSRSRGSSPG